MLGWPLLVSGWVCLVLSGCRAPESDADEDETETSGTGEETGDGDFCADPDPQDWPDPVVHLSRAEGDTFIEILDVVSDEDLVFACTGTQGLTIWDVADPQQTRMLVEMVAPSGLSSATFPRCQHFARQPGTDRAVITSRGDEIQPTPWLFTYDVSDPENPVELKGWSGDHSIEGAVFHGERIIAAAHGSGVVVFEDQGGDDLVEVGSYADQQSDAWLPLVIGDVLLVAEGATGLRTYDLSGGTPDLMATLELSGSSKDVVVDGDIAYVASSNFINVVDVSDPANPELLSETTTLGTTLAIAKAQGDMVVTAEWDEIRGYDVSDPLMPTLAFSDTVPVVAGISTYTRVLGIDARPSDGRIYAGEWEGLHIYEQRSLEPSPDIWTLRHQNFGVVELGESEDRVVVLHNLGDAPLRIFDVGGTNPEFEVDPTCLEVPPGESRAVEVTYTPSDLAQGADTLVFLTDDPDETLFTLDVIGNVMGADVGDPFPEFELFDLDGGLWNNQALEGKVTILAYFATF